MNGPQITDQEFFGLLDPDRPELAGVRAAAQAGDWPAAEAAFAAHVRARQEPRWFFDWRESGQHRDPAYDTARAELIVRDVLESCSVPYDFSGGEIDWELNPINYKEWTWQLSRHPFWVTLGEAYWATGDERYAAAFVRQMLHWVAHVPRPEDSGNPWREDRTNCWRTIECGIRMGRTWFPASYRFLNSPTFTPHALCTMVKSMVEHARHLLQWPQSGNWLVMEANGLYHVGVMFPEFTEAAEWRRAAMERLYRELDAQVYPDGAQIELSSGYHQVSLNNFVKAYDVGQLNRPDFPAGYLAKLERMYHYDLYLSMPDGRLPALNDGGYTEILPYMIEGAGFFPQRADFRWAATGGREGAKPAALSYDFPYAGHLVMRTGWERDDRYLFFDAGPFGYGHQHEDKLNIVLYAYGKVLVADPGNYPYDDSPWRKYVLSTRGHNTIRVDGMDQHQRGRPRSEYVVERPLPHTWITTDRYDYAAAEYAEGYGSQFSAEPADRTVTHIRKILFVRPEFWLMADFLAAADDAQHTAESLLHLDAEGAQALDTAVTTQGEGANLAVLAVASAPLGTALVYGQEQPEAQGWIPRGGPYEVRPIPTVAYRASWRGTLALGYVLYPLRPGQASPIRAMERVEVDAGGAPAIGLRLELADGRAFVYAQRHGRLGPMRFAEFETDAEAALVEWRDGQVVAATAVNGETVRPAV